MKYDIDSKHMPMNTTRCEGPREREKMPTIETLVEIQGWLVTNQSKVQTNKI